MSCFFKGLYIVTCNPDVEWGHTASHSYGDYQAFNTDSASAPTDTTWTAGAEHELTANQWYHQTRYWYESEPGYPKNEVSTFSESATFNSSGIKVFDELGNERVAISGWYKVLAGERVTVVKYVDTPTLAVYSDSVVADLASFGSYSDKHYDKSITWEIDSNLDISVIHGNSFNMLGGMPQLALAVESEALSRTITR